MNKLIIDGREIYPGQAPYIIAELSANHNGEIERAKQLILLARQAGADAVKLQTYRADTITLDASTEDFMIRGGLWDGKNLYQLYQQAQMPWDWHLPLFDFAKSVGITIFSSPFDNTAVDLLENLNAPAYKVASFEAIDLPLIKYIASTGKPMIISTGMANIEEISEAVEAAREGGCKQLAILHCVSGYPASAKDYNLRTIADMQQRFGVVTGLSDHTIDNITAITSVAMGAAIIEKHFTLDRSGGGTDDSFSLEPAELSALCRDTKLAWQALGSVSYERQQSEVANAKFRRSLYFVNDLAAGQKVMASDIRSVRPGFGLAPKYFEQIIGRTLKIAVKRNTPTDWKCFTD
jgi:pseudaminic acid synthase